jgi:hypothetical protein
MTARRHPPPIRRFPAEQETGSAAGARPVKTPFCLAGPASC